MKQFKLPRVGTLPFKGFDTNIDKLVLESFHNKLVKDGHCYLKVIGGDYDGSLAKFTISDICKNDKFERRGGRSGINVKTYWSGRLSWEGARNNPKFNISSSCCTIVEHEEGETIETDLIRFDLKKEGAKLLEKKVCDIEGNILNVGDKVIYMNLRYGCGGGLCKGVVKSFKAHARQGFVSVIIENSRDVNEQSECRYPEMQIMKENSNEN